MLQNRNFLTGYDSVLLHGKPLYDDSSHASKRRQNFPEESTADMNF